MSAFWTLLWHWLLARALRPRRRELLREVAVSGVEFDHPGMDYVVVQIDRDTWDCLRELAGEVGWTVEGDGHAWS